MIMPRFVWSDLDDERGRPVFQARVMGGGSTVNGMQAQRGFITDYDDWARFGVVGWGGDDVLPYFRKLEADRDRSEEHTSELQSLMRISYAVFCLKKKKRK